MLQNAFHRVHVSMGRAPIELVEKRGCNADVGPCATHEPHQTSHERLAPLNKLVMVCLGCLFTVNAVDGQSLLEETPGAHAIFHVELLQEELFNECLLGDVTSESFILQEVPITVAPKEP